MKKIIASMLIGIGIVLIAYAIYSSFSIFMMNGDIPQVFDKIEISQDLSEEQEIMLSLVGGIDITKFLNLFAWSMFAGILIFAGTSLARIGADLYDR